MEGHLLSAGFGAIGALLVFAVAWGRHGNQLKTVVKDLGMVQEDLRAVQETLKPITAGLTKLDAIAKDVARLEEATRDLVEKREVDQLRNEQQRMSDRVETVAKRTHEQGNEIQRVLGRMELDRRRAALESAGDG